MIRLQRTALASTVKRNKIQWQIPALQHQSRLQKRNITIEQLNTQKAYRERIVILGSGWAGYTLARDLDPKKFQVVILASTSVGTLEFRTALEPVRSRRSQANFFQGWADDIDFHSQTLTIEEAVEDPRQNKSLTSSMSDDSNHSTSDPGNKAPKGGLFTMHWDKLAIAVGSYNQTFNTPGVRSSAYFLKDISDARRIRTRILSCFETAALPTTSPSLKSILLNFAVVGGGPTGIEWAAELHDLIHEDLRTIYPDLVPLARITVYDVADKVLPMFDARLAEYAAQHFRREGIAIKTQHHVLSLRRGLPAGRDAVPDTSGCYTLQLKEEGEVGVGMCVWSTGLAGNPFLTQSALRAQLKQTDKSRNLLTNKRLQTLHSTTDSAIANVFALGDCAAVAETPYPATAQVASQQAAWLAKRLNKGDLEGLGVQFTYRDLGVMAYLGDWKAVLQSQGGRGLSGRAAWVVWRGAYLTKSVSWRNKVLIPVYWFLNWVFGRDVSRF